MCSLSVVASSSLTFHIFIFFSRTIFQQANFNQTWHKASFDDGDSSLSRMKSCALFQDIYEIVKIHWRNLKIFSRTTWWISTKSCTKHPWVIGIQVCSNKGPRPFTRGDTCKYKIVKLHWQNFKIFFFRTTGPISTKSGAKHLWVKGIHVCSNEGPYFFPTGDYYEISKKYWRNFKNLLRQNHRVNFNKLSTKHLWWRKFKFPRGNNCKIVIIHWQNWKIFFSRTNEPISTIFGRKHLWVKGIQVC